MMPLSLAELEAMQATQEAAMMDQALLAEPSLETDDYNLPQESFDWNSATPSVCGFNGNPSRELLDQVPMSEAVMRLPVDTSMTALARVRLIERFGQPITPITFAVIGLPRKGPSGLLIWLRKITDGSDG